MIGLTHRVFMQMIEKEGGPESFRQICELADIDPDFVFRMNEPYPDSQWQAMFAAACSVLKKTSMEIEHLYAKAFFAFIRQRFGVWFDMCKNAREFLELQPTIHNSFATGLREPVARRNVIDKFRLETGPNHIITHYSSPNRLCGYYVALAQLVIRYYGDTATVQQPRCMKRGDKECEIVVHWFGEDE